jgi:hypothetical protein
MLRATSPIRAGPCARPNAWRAAISPRQNARTAPSDPDSRRLNERLRAEWVAGAEEEWRKRTGRPMTAEDLERVLKRYPGDM